MGGREHRLPVSGDAGSDLDPGAQGCQPVSLGAFATALAERYRSLRRTPMRVREGSSLRRAAEAESSTTEAASRSEF